MVCAFLATVAAPASADWPVYGHDLANSRSGGTDGPSFAQLPTLKEAWRFDVSPGDFTGTPVVAGGLVVAGDYSGIVYALDARTGKLRWKTNLHDQINASAAINKKAGLVFVPVAKKGSPRLVALSLRDGKQRWSTVLSSQPTSFSYGSPTFWAGLVYMGTSGPNGDGSTARGTVVAVSQRTGAVRWRTYTVPSGRDGGPVWSTPAIDTSTARLYVGTGNAYHAPAAPTTDAILALDARTGAMLGHYQATSGDTFAADNPAGPDVDFGASPNLFVTPAGKRVVGEGAKDANYYVVDRMTMAEAWKTTNGPSSPIGGYMGSTGFDGTRIYGINALTTQIMAMNRDGTVDWTSVDGGSAEWSPVATANGVLYTLSNSGTISARDARTGTVLKTVSVGAPTFAGVSTTGGAIYAAVGTGPAPEPAPQDSNRDGAIVAFGDTSRSGAPRGGPGGGPSGGPGGSGRARSKCRRRGGARLRLRVRPRRARAGRRTRFHFRVTCKGRPVRRAVVRFAHRRNRTGRRGRAGFRIRLRHRGRRVARVTKRGLRSGRVVVRVRRRR